MGRSDTLGPHDATDRTYEDFIEQAKNMEELVHYEQKYVLLCSELYAHIRYRTVYNDKKIFSKEGSYYRPTDICMVGNNVRPEFVKLIHAENTIYKQYYLSPLHALQLLAGIESFLNNQLDTRRSYNEEKYSLSFMSREDKQMLCVNYGEGRKESHMDKYRCRVFATTLRNIMNISTYRY